MVLRTRFAPTPSGFLHWGNAYSFVLTWLHARLANGVLLLRIDDLDATRTRPEYIEDVFRSLEWLGLDYDEGPAGPDEHRRVYSQRLRLARYSELLSSLEQSGRLFGCDCSRRTIEAQTDGLHPAACQQRQLPLHDAEVAWRVDTSLANRIAWEDLDGQAHTVELHREMRDFVVRRKDGIPAYQVASLADDLAFGVNCVVRGADLLVSTAAQRFLATTLGEEPFLQARFLHHALIMDEGHRKLSKSSGATSLRAMRARHRSPEQLYQMLSPYFGLSEAVGSVAELLECVESQRDSKPSRDS